MTNLERALSYTEKTLIALDLIERVKKHTVRYALFAALATIVALTSTFLYFVFSDAPAALRWLLTFIYLIGYPALSRLIAHEKGRHEILLPVLMVLVFFFAMHLMPLCFVIMALLPYESFRRTDINS